MKFMTLIILFYSSAYASEWKGALGFLAKTQNVKRGIITYKGHQIQPIVSIEKEGLPFMIAGSSLYYRTELKKNYYIRSRIRMNSTGDHPSYFTETPESETIQREKTNEWDTYLEYLNANQYIRFQYTKDLNAHKSNYYEIHARQAIYNYKRKDVKAIIQPSLYASIGYGDKDHNEYLYGEYEHAEAGFNNYEVGLIIASPNVIDPFWPTLKLNYFEILGDDNRQGAYVKDKQGISFELLMGFRVF